MIRIRRSPRIFQTDGSNGLRARLIINGPSASQRRRPARKTKTAPHPNAQENEAMNAKIIGAMNRLRAVKGDPMTTRNVRIRPSGDAPSGAKSLRIPLRVEKGAEMTLRAKTRRGETMTLSGASIRLRRGAKNAAISAKNAATSAKNAAIRLRIERGAETTRRRRATTRRSGKCEDQIPRRAITSREMSSGDHRHLLKTSRRARWTDSIHLPPPAKDLLHVQRNDRPNARRRAGPITNSGIATWSGVIAPPRRRGQTSPAGLFVCAEKGRLL
jgi:hypothetical protein